MTKNLSQIEALDQKHAEDTQARKGRIEAAMKELRESEALLREATDKVRQLQADQVKASFAYDAERSRLLSEEDAARKGTKAA